MSATAEITREPLKKKDLVADQPTWCPGCGDFSVLALYFKLIQNRGLHQEKFATVAGIGPTSPPKNPYAFSFAMVWSRFLWSITPRIAKT